MTKYKILQSAHLHRKKNTKLIIKAIASSIFKLRRIFGLEQSRLQENNLTYIGMLRIIFMQYMYAFNNVR